MFSHFSFPNFFKENVVFEQLVTGTENPITVIQADRYQPDKIFAISSNAVLIMQQNGSLSLLGYIPPSSYGDIYQMNPNTIILTNTFANCLLTFDRIEKRWSNFSGDWVKSRRYSTDGSISNATYVQPQGMAYHEEGLLVVEPYTKKIRQIFLINNTVTTLFTLSFQPRYILTVKETWVISSLSQIFLTNNGLENLSILANSGSYFMHMINLTDNVVIVDELDSELRVINTKTHIKSTMQCCDGKRFLPRTITVANSTLYISNAISIISLNLEEYGKYLRA